MKRIGVVGFGFVGRAVAHGFVLHAIVKAFDKYGDCPDTLESTVNDSDYIFVAVPTPMSDDGSQDLSLMTDAIDEIVKVAKRRKIIILKSTIIPGTTRKFAEKYPDFSFVFNPEFLTQRTADLDFINPSRIILGGEKSVVDEVELLYRDRFTCTPIFKTTWEGAEITKYMCNAFFAVKISFLNEFYDIAEWAGIPFNELRDLWLSDGRIGNSHVDVPGHDGHRGYGGKCFPKDVRAIVKWAESIGLRADVAKAADAVNLRVRTEKDWESIRGATSSNSFAKPKTCETA